MIKILFVGGALLVGAYVAHRWVIDIARNTNPEDYVYDPQLHK